MTNDEVLACGHPCTDTCDTCGNRVCEDEDCENSYGWAADTALLCYPCLDREAT